MHFPHFRRWAYGLFWASSIPLLASSSSTVSPKTSGTAAYQAWDSEADASALLKEIKSISATLKTATGTLESFSRQPQLSWQTHAYQLNQVREQINTFGEHLDGLQAMQSGMAPWQQSALDQMMPLAAIIAAHAESAIQHVNEHRPYLFAPVYADHLTSLSNRSGDLKQTLDTFLEWGDTLDQLDRLEQKLDRVREKIGLLAS